LDPARGDKPQVYGGETISPAPPKMAAPKGDKKRGKKWGGEKEKRTDHEKSPARKKQKTKNFQGKGHLICEGKKEPSFWGGGPVEMNWQTQKRTNGAKKKVKSPQVPPRSRRKGRRKVESEDFFPRTSRLG